MSPLVQNQTPQPPLLSFLSPLVYNPRKHPPTPRSCPRYFFSSCEEGTGRAATGLSARAGGSILNLQLRWAVVAISSCCWQCTEPSLHPLCQHRGRRPGRRTFPQLPGAGMGWPCPSLLPPQGRDESVLGWKQNKDTWFVLSFKEHLFLGKVLGPRVAGGAAGSARRRHGRFCCAFLKERKEETSQPTLSLRPLCFQGWRLGKDDDVVQPVTTRFSLLPTKPNRMKERRQ